MLYQIHRINKRVCILFRRLIIPSQSILLTFSPINPSADINVTPSRDARDEGGSEPEVTVAGRFQTTYESDFQEKKETPRSPFKVCVSSNYVDKH